MSKTLSKKLELSDISKKKEIANCRPKGYKGLSGFHKYWGKKPTEAWRFLIENLTEINDVVLDPFLGSGLIAKECTDLERSFIGFDVNPICIELTNLYLDLPSFKNISKALTKIEQEIKPIINQMYLLSDENIATHFLWENEKITKVWTKAGRKRIELDLPEKEFNKLENVEIYHSSHIRNIRLFDNSRINSKAHFRMSNLFTYRALRAIDLLKSEIEKYEGNIKRALLLILSSSLGQMSKMVFAVTKRGKTTGQQTNNIEVGSWVIGYWCPKQHFEVNAWNCFDNKAKKLLKAIKEIGVQQQISITSNIDDFVNNNSQVCITVGDSEVKMKELKSESVSVILTDPPHGDRIPYLELSEMWNSVLGLDSIYEEELIVSNAKARNKTIDNYNKKLSAIFSECTRVLKNDGLLTVIFNARSKEHWNSIHKLEETAVLDYIGSYPMEYSAHSVVQGNRKGGLKTDFVLVYGKNITSNRKEHIINVFNTINEWSTNYPNRVDLVC